MAEHPNALEETRHLDAAGVSKLKLSWKRGAVTLIGEARDDVVATTIQDHAGGWTFERAHDTVVLEQDTEQALMEARRIDLTVRVPISLEKVDAHVAWGNFTATGLHGKLDLRNDVGDVSLSDRQGPTDAWLGQGKFQSTHHQGKLDLKSGAGNVTLEDVVGAVNLKAGLGTVTLHSIIGTVDATVGRGDVTIRGLRDDLRLKAGDGRVTIADARESALDIIDGRGDIVIGESTLRLLHVKTGLGEVRCDAFLRPGAHDIRSGLGSVVVVLPGDASLRIDASTGWGDIESDFPLVRVGRPGPTIFGGQRYVGSIGQGTALTELKVRTGKGDIRIRRSVYDRYEGIRETPSEPPTPSRPEPVRDTPPPPPVPPTPHVPPTPPTPPEPTSPPVSSTPTTDPRLAILDALRRGEITVEEADQRLRELA